MTIFPGREVPLGRYTTVQRMLPQRDIRTIGAWCFLDHFGPQSVINLPGMRVPPHPHIGLQTVTWLLEGEIVHRDSLGSLRHIRPGELNLMTSGRGISHSEESPSPHPPGLHGLQLWIALPQGVRDGAADFAHFGSLPSFEHGTVVLGSLDGVTSPATVHSPLVGASISLNGTVDLPLDRRFEHGIVVTSGKALVNGALLEPHALASFEPGAPISLEGNAELFLIGGEPFGDKLVMWWNFVGRSHEEIASARSSWRSGDGRFGVVHGYNGDPLPAPPLPTARLLPR